MKTYRPHLLFCFLLSTFCFPALGQYSIDWFTIDGGGGHQHRWRVFRQRHHRPTRRRTGDERRQLLPHRRVLVPHFRRANARCAKSHHYSLGHERYCLLAIALDRICAAAEQQCEQRCWLVSFWRHHQRQWHHKKREHQPANKLHVAGGVSATAFVTTSDRNAKENFTPVSPLEALNKVAALPITTWNFKSMNDDRHMGPIAQDFYAAFGLGGGDTTITGVAPDGVALGADRQEPYVTPRRLNLGGEFRGPFDSALWAVFKFRQPSWQRPCPRSANCDNFGRFLMCAQRSQRAAQVFAFRS